MRNLIIVGVLVFLAVLLGGGAIVWFFQSEALKSNVEKTISDLNKDQSFITYSAIETSGFPLNVNVSIVNPHFNGPVDLFLVKAFTDSATKAESTFRDVIPWSEDAALDGSLTIGVNIFSNVYSVRMQGNWKSNTTISGTDSKLLVSHASSESFCNLTLKNRNVFASGAWSLKTFSLDNKDLIDNIRAIDCNVPSGSIAAQTAGTEEETLLSSNGPQRIYITQDIQKNQRKLRLYVQSTDAEVTKDGNDILYQYMQSFNKTTLPPRLDALGKQSVEVDATFDAPLEIKDIFNDPINIAVSKAHMDNQVETNDGQLFYSVDPQGENRIIKLGIHLNVWPKEGYDNLIASKAHDLFHQYYTSTDDASARIKAALHRFPVEDDMHPIIADAIPRMEPLKKLFYGMEGMYQGNKDMSNGMLTLTDLQIGALPYGVSATGTLRKLPDTFPEPNLSITCRSCIYLVDDLADYFNRVQQAFAKFDPMLATPYAIKPGAIESLKTFLKLVADAPDSAPSADLNYHISGDGTPNITINGKTQETLQTLYVQAFPPTKKP